MDYWYYKIFDWLGIGVLKFICLEMDKELLIYELIFFLKYFVWNFLNRKLFIYVFGSF